MLHIDYQRQIGIYSYLNTITAMLTRKHDNSDDVSTYIWFLCLQRYILIRCTLNIKKKKLNFVVCQITTIIDLPRVQCTFKDRACHNFSLYQEFISLTNINVKKKT